MKQSFVKMMNRISEIENYILKGLVLDEHGNWIPIVEKKAVEEEFLAHLSAGHVLYEGRWVDFTEAKKVRLKTPDRPPKKRRAAPPAAETAVIAEPPPIEEEPSFIQAPAPVSPGAQYPPETSIIMEHAPEEETRIGQAPASMNPEAEVPFPPETSIIVDALTAEEETRVGHAPPPSDVVVDTEEFAPETKVILITPPTQYATEPVAAVTRETDVFPVEASSGEQMADGPKMQTTADYDDTRIFNRPSVPTWENSGEKRKKLILFVGGAIVIAAGIAGIIVIIVLAPN
jgi:hypothetical protein